MSSGRRISSSAILVAITVSLVLSSTATLLAATSEWTRIEHPALSGGGHVVYVWDVLPPDGSSPWTAVGYLVDSDGRRIPSAWRSTDGLSWQRTTMAPTGSPEPRDGPTHVARSGTVTVALGNRFDERVKRAAWRSSGPTWAALEDKTDPLLQFEGAIDALSSTEAGFVAVGVRHTAYGSDVTIFRSVDGARWSTDGGFVTPVGEGFEALDVLDTGDTLLVVGDTSIGGQSDGRIWTRTRGRWTSVDPARAGLDGAGYQQVAAIATHPSGGFIAGGVVMRRGIEFPTIWVSPDGLSWERLPERSVPPSSDSAAIHEIVRAGGELLAVGASGTGLRAWRSTNGRAWKPLATPPSWKSIEFASVTAASDGRRVVVVAREETGSYIFRRHGSTWTRVDRGRAFPRRTPTATELRDVATTGSRTIAIGNDARNRPLVLSSTNGRAWHKVPFVDPKANLLAVTASRGRFTIVGWRKLLGRAYLAAWTSRDGRVWRRSGGEIGSIGGAFVDVAVDGKRLVAVALEGFPRGFRTSVWTGDGTDWTSPAPLGPGEARAVCVGPQGTTIVATEGKYTRSRILVWTRRRGGRKWPAEPEVVATGGDATHCADTPIGTVIVGTNNGTGAAMAWIRARSGVRWDAAVIGKTLPRTTVHDVQWDRGALLVSGSTGARGQSDLAFWNSLDGRSWPLVAGVEPVFVEPGYQVGLASTRVGDRLVTVGRHGAGDGAIWVGRG